MHNKIGIIKGRILKSTKVDCRGDVLITMIHAKLLLVTSAITAVHLLILKFTLTP